MVPQNDAPQRVEMNCAVCGPGRSRAMARLRAATVLAPIMWIGHAQANAAASWKRNGYLNDRGRVKKMFV